MACALSPPGARDRAALQPVPVPTAGRECRAKARQSRWLWQLRAELVRHSSPVAGLAVSELHFCVLPSPPAGLALGKSAHVAISAELHREIPRAAVSSWAPDCLQCLCSPSVWAEVRSLEELSAFWPRVPAPGSGDAGCSGAMKPPPAKVAASMMQFIPELSWGNGHSTVQCCSLALTQPPENTGSSQGRANSHQQNTHHRGGSHISIHP